MIEENKEKQYFIERWNVQTNYYSRRARQYKYLHQTLIFISCIGSLIVPILLTIQQVSSIIPMLVSLLVSIYLALDSRFQFGDNWRDFRNTLEALKNEKIYYEYKIGAYSDPQKAFSLFVQRCEEITHSENKSFFKKYRDHTQSGNPLNHA